MSQACKESTCQALEQVSREFGASRARISPVLEREIGFGYGFRREKTRSDTFGSVLFLFSDPETYKGSYNLFLALVLVFHPHL